MLGEKKTKKNPSDVAVAKLCVCVGKGGTVLERLNENIKTVCFF